MDTPVNHSRYSQQTTPAINRAKTQETRLLESDNNNNSNWALLLSEPEFLLPPMLSYSTGNVPNSDAYLSSIGQSVGNYDYENNTKEGKRRSFQEEEGEEEEEECLDEDTFRADEEEQEGKKFLLGSTSTNDSEKVTLRNQLADILSFSGSQHSGMTRNSRSKRARNEQDEIINKRLRTSYDRFSSEADNEVFRMSLPPSSPLRDNNECYSDTENNEEYDTTYRTRPRHNNDHSSNDLILNNTKRMNSREGPRILEDDSGLFQQAEEYGDDVDNDGSSDSHGDTTLVEGFESSNSSLPSQTSAFTSFSLASASLSVATATSSEQSHVFHNNIFCYLDPETGYKNAQKILIDAIDEGYFHLKLSNLSLQNLPPEINDIQNLVSLDHQIILDLSDNKLTELPAGVFQIKHMEVLGLARNAFKTIPAAIHKLVNLKVLRLDGNDECKYLPAELFGLKKLEWLSATCLSAMDAFSKSLCFKDEEGQAPLSEAAGTALKAKKRILESKMAMKGNGLPFAFRNMVRYWVNIDHMNITKHELNTLLRFVKKTGSTESSTDKSAKNTLNENLSKENHLGLSFVKGLSLKETVLQMLCATGLTKDHSLHLENYFPNNLIPNLIKDANHVHRSCGVCHKAPLVVPLGSAYESWYDTAIKQELVFKRNFCSTKCLMHWAAEIQSSIPEWF